MGFKSRIKIDGKRNPEEKLQKEKTLEELKKEFKQCNITKKELLTKINEENKTEKCKNLQKKLEQLKIRINELVAEISNQTAKTSKDIEH